MKTRMNGLIVFLSASVLCGTGFAKEWIYDASKSAMTDADGKWTVSVSSVENVGQGELTIGKAIEPFGDKTGTLDLRDIVFVKDGVNYSITALKLQDSGVSYAMGVTNFYVNNVVGTIPSNMFSRAVTLKSVWISGEGVVELGKNVFNSCAALLSVRLDCPNLLSVGENAFYKCTSLSGDIAEVMPWGVTNLGSSAFRLEGNKSLTGTLILTNLFYLGGNAFRGCAGLMGIDLRGPITRFNGSAFQNCTALAEAFFDTPKLALVEYQASSSKGDFYKTALTNVSFLCAAVGQADVIDKILGGVRAVGEAEEASKECTLYVSRDQAGWSELARGVDLTTAEAKYIPADEENFMGVYVTADGKRKAWMIHRSSPHDTKGLVIRIQ